MVKNERSAHTQFEFTLTSRDKQAMGVEVSRLTAPLEVHQGIALTLPENAACSLPWEEYI